MQKFSHITCEKYFFFFVMIEVVQGNLTICNDAVTCNANHCNVWANAATLYSTDFFGETPARCEYIESIQPRAFTISSLGIFHHFSRNNWLFHWQFPLWRSIHAHFHNESPRCFNFRCHQLLSSEWWWDGWKLLLLFRNKSSDFNHKVSHYALRWKSNQIHNANVKMGCSQLMWV